MQAKMQRAAWRAQYRGAQRGSMLGPLFLTAIGVFALLATTHHISLPSFWQWYGHWWPLILIGAGVLLALESLAFSRHSRVRLGGGMVLLMMILALLGIAAAHNHVNWSAIGDQIHLDNDDLNLSQMFGNRHDASEEIVHALPPNATVVIQNPHGDVTITTDNTAAAADQIHLSLKKTVYSNSDSESKQKLQALEPLITSNGSVIVVHMPSSDSEMTDMDVTLPASATVEVKAGHGDVLINGIHAPVTVNADHGDVQLAGIAGDAHIVMRDGDFSASNIQGSLTLSGHMNDVTLSQVSGTAGLDGDFFGDIHLDALHGGVHLHSSRTDIQVAQLAGSIILSDDDLSVENATGPVTVATRAKDVALRQITGEVRVSNSNGGVEVTTLDPVGAISIENSNGSVQVTLPADGKFSVQATSVQGDVHTSFALSTQNGNDHSIVSGSVNGGGPLVHITAEKGDIALHKGD